VVDTAVFSTRHSGRTMVSISLSTSLTQRNGGVLSSFHNLPTYDLIYNLRRSHDNAAKNNMPQTATKKYGIIYDKVTLWVSLQLYRTYTCR